MKKLSVPYMIVLLLLIACKDPKTAVPDLGNTIIVDGIRWTGGNPIANHMAASGLNRYITYENNHAFIMSEAAVEQDSSLFASHVLLAMLAVGERKEYHKNMANRYVENENETSKLFVSLLDFDHLNDSTGAERSIIWTRMHELSNDPFIHYMYIRYMEGDNSDKIAELRNLIDFCQKNDFRYTATAAYNMMAYLLNREGDLAAGIKAVDQCIYFHPNGYNPIDSRAEFYLFEGDTANAIETYKKVLEKYPYTSYAKAQLELLE